jgi:glycerol uptake facilitator protein/aquaporin Z
MAPRRLVRNSGLELLLTFVLMFCVATIVRWVVGPSPISRALPNIHLELGVVGAAVGLVMAGLILSPPGRVTGGHMNPAISLVMWLFGTFRLVGVAPYAVAQLCGSLLGVLAARVVWGPAVAHPPVSYSVLEPAPTWGWGELFATEMLSMAVILVIVGLVMSVPRLAPKLLPWVVGFLVGAAIALLGTFSGGSDNPAREFGPAIASGQVRYLWAYLIAPMVGAVLAAAVLRVTRRRRRMTTHRLSGTADPALAHTGAAKPADPQRRLAR